MIITNVYVEHVENIVIRLLQLSQSMTILLVAYVSSSWIWEVLLSFLNLNSRWSCSQYAHEFKSQ